MIKLWLFSLKKSSNWSNTGLILIPFTRGKKFQSTSYQMVLLGKRKNISSIFRVIQLMFNSKLDLMHDKLEFQLSLLLYILKESEIT